MRQDVRLVRDFQELTSLARGAVPSDRLLDFVVQDPSNAPAPFKKYVGVDQVQLPTNLAAVDAPAGEVMAGMAGNSFGGRTALGARELASLLFFAAGVTRTSIGPDGAPVYFRAAPAGGNLHAHEVYVATGDLAEVPAGLYHLRPDLHRLETLRTQDCRAALARVAAHDALASAPITVVVTGVPWRKGWRYRERGFRHIVRDIGSMIANLLYVADALGIPSEVLVGFEDAGVAQLLGVTPDAEPPIAIIRLGEGSTSSGPDRLPDLALEVEPLSARPYEFPLVTEVRAAGDLLDERDIATFRARASAVGTPVAAGQLRRDDPRSLQDVILSRGSTRVMRHEVVSQDALIWSMGVATMPTRSDFAAPGATLVDSGISVHAVQDIRPGRHAWRSGTLEEVVLMPEAEARASSQELTAGQPLGGDSAYTTYLSFDWEAVVGALGARGFRAALLESGIALGRLNLAACALGYGASGLTTFDSDVPSAFDAAWTNVAACAVGVPTYRARKGGLPGQPTEIEGLARTRALMAERLQRTERATEHAAGQPHGSTP